MAVTGDLRGKKPLDEAVSEILAVRQDKNQKINAVAGDMGNAANMPDILYCVAGGTPSECGFLVDLKPEIFERCMVNNFYSSVYPAQAVLKRWVEDDDANDAEIRPRPRTRKIIFVNSSASLIPTPGYLAYSAAKAAQRALADTMRLEAMRYSGPQSNYIVQCIFAHNFITPTFLEEQKSKPSLTKRIEGTEAIGGDSAADISALESRFPSAHKIAPEIVAAVATNDFAVLDKRLEPQILWANMIGTSPRRGWGIVDSLLAFLMFLVYPFVRRQTEHQCRGDALRRA
ncbi:hypothetical protein AAE478_001235 [Parahypoxylon ruwenzoriense]